MPDLPPSTIDYIRFHALHRPSSVALINHDRQITYAQFYSDLRKLIPGLREFALPAASSVAVECDDVYLHWLLLLACEALGLVSASFVGTEGAGSAALLAHVDLALCEHDPPRDGAKRTHRLTAGWLAELLAREEPAETSALGGVICLDQPQRIRRSSGSTGLQKMMVARRGGEERMLHAFAVHMGFSPETRLLITVSFAVASMYMRATACLRLGATCIFDPRLSIAQAIQTHKPTHVRLFQYEAVLLLRELPPSLLKPERLTVMLGAAPLSDELRREISSRLATNLIYTYNTNETMMIAVIDAHGIATPRPGAEAQVVDDDGTPLPPGRAGRIRVRTDSQVDSYLDDLETTARLFRDGWVYTGDLGVLIGDRRFKVLGRVDEVLNIGGIKYLPSEIENEIARIAPVKDVGVTSVLGDGGAEEIAIALVLKPAVQFDAVLDLLSKSVPASMRAHVIAVDALPRTETGKLQRHVLKSMFRRST